MVPIEIEVFPAGNGDAILIHIGEALVLVDGGFKSTYRDHLKDKLRELDSNGNRLSRLIVTHIDADHISGAIALLEDNGSAHNPNIIGIDEIWFNSYRHLRIPEKQAGTFQGKQPDIPINRGLESAEAEIKEGLVSYPQGTSLGSLILKYNYNWNTSFGGGAVKADRPHVVHLTNDIKLTLLGPNTKALDTLADKWVKYLRKRFDGDLNEDEFFDDAFELMMEEKRQQDLADNVRLFDEKLVAGGMDWVEDNAIEWTQEDESETNGSSIIFLLEHNDRKLLFLGDAIPGQVCSQLRKLEPNYDFPLELDLLKVSHHGAWSNNSPQLIDLVRAKNYLFSSDGSRHQHPHFETMAWILKKVGNSKTRNFILNYRQVHRLGVLDSSTIMEKYNYKTTWPDVDEFGKGLDGYVKIRIEE